MASEVFVFKAGSSGVKLSFSIRCYCGCGCTGLGGQNLPVSGVRTYQPGGSLRLSSASGR